MIIGLTGFARCGKDTAAKIIADEYNYNIRSFAAPIRAFVANLCNVDDMDIFDSNVRILVNPLVDTTILHFISAQITWTGVPVPGLLIQTQPTSDTIETENEINIETENQNTV